MADRILKAVVSPLATELAEYTILLHDLQAANDALALWFDKYAPRKNKLNPEERLIAQSLFRDSIVMFVGCFDSTAPLRLSVEEIYGKLNGGIRYFEWLKDIRDSYAAHKFGALRQCVAGLMVDENGKSHGAGHVDQTYAGPVVEGRDTVLSFIARAGRHVAAKITDLSHQLADVGKKMSASELTALKPARTKIIDPEDYRMSRRKLKT